MTAGKAIRIDYFSDLLCVWAYAAEARVAELKRNFGEQIEIRMRFCNVFGDTAWKIGRGWQDRGAYEGFARHVHEVAQRFGHIQVHPQLWLDCRPASSMGAHVFVKAVQLLPSDGDTEAGAETLAERLAHALRLAFFRDGRDIGRLAVLGDVARRCAVDLATVEELLANGRAYAALAADERDRETWRIEGSPTFVLNEGRQKLYGNLGYRVLEANIRELLREPAAGAASWC